MIYDCHGFPSFSSRPPELFGTGSSAAFRPYRAIQVALRYYCQLVLGLHKSEARISCVGGCVTGPGSGAIISYRWHGRGRNAGKIYVHVEQDMGSVGLDTRPANWISPPAAAPTHPKRFFFCSTVSYSFFFFSCSGVSHRGGRSVDHAMQCTEHG
jgi:hypothetical protein